MKDSGAAAPSAMERHLRTKLDGLVKVAIEQGSPALAEHLRASVRKGFVRQGSQLIGAIRGRVFTSGIMHASKIQFFAMPFKERLKSGEPRKRPKQSYVPQNWSEYNRSLRKRGMLSL